jgi:Protein of unknown function (DUF2846)
MTLTLRCLVTAAALLLAGPAVAQTTPAAPSAVAAPTSAGPVGAPPTGKGQIVFFRPSGFLGMALYFKIRENGTELGKLTNGAYFVATVDPGKHTYDAQTENKDHLTLEVDDGETYYVRGGMKMGLIVYEASITPSDQATFEQDFKHLHLADPLPPAKTAPATPAATAQ